MNQKPNPQHETRLRSAPAPRPGIHFAPSVPPLPPGASAPESPEAASLKLTESQTFERLSVWSQQPGAPPLSEARQLAVIHFGPIDATGHKQGYILSLNDPKAPDLVLARYQVEDLAALLDLIREHLKSGQ